LYRQKKKSVYLSAMPADGMIAAYSSNDDFGTSRLKAALYKLHDLTRLRKRSYGLRTRGLEEEHNVSNGCIFGYGFSPSRCDR
jgi:hypothetical protein